MIVTSVSFRVMEAHVNKLSKLCRICSSTEETGRGYSNAKTVHNLILNSIGNLLKN